jgi:hypothetical protein
MTLTSTFDDAGLPLVRNAFWHGKLMGVQEFERDQQYLLSLQRTLSRLTIGAGVLCGLDVWADGPGIAVLPGAALDGHGRLVVVPRPVHLDDVTRWICPATESGQAPPGDYVVCLLHHECGTDPVQALVTDCDTRAACRPGAVEERFRIELRLREEAGCVDVCAGCSAGRASGRACACGSECVEIATLTWDGQAIAGVTTGGRPELPSLRELHEAQRCRDEACDPAAGRAPRLVRFWPPSGDGLSREGALSAWARWRLHPRMELTFDRAIVEDRVDDTKDWIRAWAVVNDPGGSGAVVCERLELGYVREPSACGDHLRLVVEVSARALARLAKLTEATQARLGVVVQVRSDFDTGPLGVGPLQLPAQVQHAGTSLARADLERLWSGDALPDMDIDDLRPPTLPRCFTDGFDGGLLHSVFYVDPPAEELRMTGAWPYNGARVVRSELPRVQVSFARALQQPADDWLLDTVNPWLRAWFVADDGTLEDLGIQSAQLVDRPRFADLFQGDFDTTLRQELAGTVELELSAPVGVRGRVLLVSDPPATAPSIGSFAGTCLRRDHLLALLNDAPVSPKRLLEGTRPSGRLLPRSASTEGRIHWTFAWEKS